MAGIRRAFSHWRAHRCRHCAYPDVVHLYLIPHARLAAHHLYDTRFLDEHEAIHSCKKAQPAEVALIKL